MQHALANEICPIARLTGSEITGEAEGPLGRTGRIKPSVITTKLIPLIERQSRDEGRKADPKVRR